MMSIDTAVKDEKDLRKIIENYELLHKSTEEELKFYKNEQSKLRNDLLRIVEENNLLQSEIQRLKSLQVHETNEEFDRLSNDAISNLNKQIKQLTDERNTLQSLWKTSQNSVKNLEIELAGYSSLLSNPNHIFDIKKKYNESIRLLEDGVEALRSELKKKAEDYDKLIRRNKLLEAQLEQFKNKNIEQEKVILSFSQIEDKLQAYKDNLEQALRQKDDLEKSVKASEEIIKEHMIREDIALQKVQEALLISDSAVMEKDAALARERTVREECDSLASTIGQVMEEAASQVEFNIMNLKLEHKKELEEVEKTKTKMKALLEVQARKLSIAEGRSQTLEKKLKEIVDTNISLDSDLQGATQTIVELELKLEAIEMLVDFDKKASKINEENEQELQAFLSHNKQMKERWKNAIEEVTNKLHSEYAYLQKENSCLLIENQELKNKIEANFLDINQQ